MQNLQKFNQGWKNSKLSIKNKMVFLFATWTSVIFNWRKTHCAENSFMLLRDHPVGGQTFVRGNFVNVPVDIAPTKISQWKWNSYNQVK